MAAAARGRPPKSSRAEGAGAQGRPALGLEPRSQQDSLPTAKPPERTSILLERQPAPFAFASSHFPDFGAATPAPSHLPPPDLLH